MRQRNRLEGTSLGGPMTMNPAPALDCPPRHTHDGERDFCFSQTLLLPYVLSLTRINPDNTQSVQKSYAHHPRGRVCVWRTEKKGVVLTLMHIPIEVTRSISQAWTVS